tara:strand:+ start:386 stop:592 length:207 start_codon:yes stop_codon:yes gene_type:complete
LFLISLGNRNIPETIEKKPVIEKVSICPIDPAEYSSLFNNGKSIKEPTVPHMIIHTDTYKIPISVLFI